MQTFDDLVLVVGKLVVKLQMPIRGRQLSFSNYLKNFIKANRNPNRIENALTEILDRLKSNESSPKDDAEAHGV